MSLALIARCSFRNLASPPTRSLSSSETIKLDVSHGVSGDNEYRHRNNGVCANNEVFGGVLPPEAFFFFTARFNDMTEKKTGSKPTSAAANRKTAPAGSKAAPPRKRIRKTPEVLTESEIEQMAYALWESR